MRLDTNGPRFQRLRKDPATLLAALGLMRALRGAGLLRYGFAGYAIFVVPRGYRTEEYEAAAHAILSGIRDDWVDEKVKVRVANPVRPKGTAHLPVSVFDLKGLEVLIAASIEEVPKDVRFAATAVMLVEAPTPEHVNAVRRLTGKAPFSPEMAALLAAKPQNVLTAAMLKPNFSEERIDEIHDLNRRDTSGPSLFDLPGYDALKPWARRLAADVGRWRSGKLPWKLVTRGALIVGPPGTGKTFFAEGLANALGVKLISATVGDWQAEGHLDDTLAAMRKSFRDADDGEGAVLLIDELDSIGARAARPDDRNSLYWQIVITYLLKLLDNLGDGVVVVGATNFINWIDPAILRAGRLENHFELALPDQRLRAEILKHHAGDGMALESLSEIAADLKGKSAAVLEKLVRDAREAARHQDRELELGDIRERLPEKMRYTAEQQLRLAVHEAGHALVSLSLGHASSATIEIEESFDPAASEVLGGMTSYALVDDRFPTEKTLRNRIAASYGGMAAEAAVFGDRSIGSGGYVGSDVERATFVARRMVGSYGLGKTPIFHGTVESLGDKPLPERLEVEVTQILAEEWERARAILTNERERVLDLATQVMTHRSVRIETSGIAEAA